MGSIDGRRRTVALATLCLCALTAGVDLTITNVAVPFIGRALDASTNELQWVVASYSIVLAGLLVLGGAAADRYGRRRVFLVSYALFAVASLVAAFSPSVGLLIAARALMGVGAAGVTAPALAIIASMYAPEERGPAISTFVVFGASGLAVGPIAGGLLLDHFWWGSVFLVNVPVVALGVIVGARTIAESRAPEPPGGYSDLDVGGAIASVVGLGGVLFAVIEGPERGWLSPVVLVAFAVGAVALAWFVRRQLRASAPLFDVRILRRPAVLAGSVTLLVAYLVFNSFLFLTPQDLQDVRGESIVTVGVLLVPFAAVFGACSLRAHRVLARLGPRWTITSGLLVCATAAAALAATVGGPTWSSVGASVLLGAGLSVLIAPPSTVVMNDLPPAKAGHGSSLNFVSRFVGAAVGVAVVGSVLASLYASDLAAASGGSGSLDASQADRADGSLQGALEVADGLGRTDGDALAAAARDAFDRGALVAYLVIAVVALLVAAIAWAALRHVDESSGRSAPNES
ncbi:EmrB/QacA subfamily drug resistance transporter [Mumia flava]|uniref:EmrB/QacA subfamily drug resistance transporter n=1 Tax=Mumia flava TaxID=1348852 RepID=A0A2M9BGU6_9ACTN|nr:EmrB/QacA subfamily drug resistance transporter [Mumia flava]